MGVYTTLTKEKLIDYLSFIVALIAIIVTALQSMEGILPASYVGTVAVIALVFSQIGSIIRAIIQAEEIQKLQGEIKDLKAKIANAIKP